jgi:hypothetical protein
MFQSKYWFLLVLSGLPSSLKTIKWDYYKLVLRTQTTERFMPNLIKQGEAKVVTKNGEVFVNIALELTIKLDGSNLQVLSGSGVGTASQAAKQEEKVDWAIQDFASNNKIKFGK